jgi:hypothetical protein
MNRALGSGSPSTKRNPTFWCSTRTTPRRLGSLPNLATLFALSPKSSDIVCAWWWGWYQVTPWSHTHSSLRLFSNLGRSCESCSSTPEFPVESLCRTLRAVLNGPSFTIDTNHTGRERHNIRHQSTADNTKPAIISTLHSLQAATNHHNGTRISSQCNVVWSGCTRVIAAPRPGPLCQEDGTSCGGILEAGRKDDDGWYRVGNSNSAGSPKCCHRYVSSMLTVLAIDSILCF